MAYTITVNPDEIRTDLQGNPLCDHDKAFQLATSASIASGSAVPVVSQSAAVYSAGESVAIHFNGSYSKAWFCPDVATFNLWKNFVIPVDFGLGTTAVASIKFVDVPGAATIAGRYVGNP
jgi:hypothetical protein